MKIMNYSELKEAADKEIKAKYSGVKERNLVRYEEDGFYFPAEQYSVSLDQLNTHYKFIDFLLHLRTKDWFCPQTQDDFLSLVESRINFRGVETQILPYEQKSKIAQQFVNWTKANNYSVPSWKPEFKLNSTKDRVVLGKVILTVDPEATETFKKAADRLMKSTGLKYPDAFKTVYSAVIKEAVNNIEKMGRDYEKEAFNAHQGGK